MIGCKSNIDVKNSSVPKANCPFDGPLHPSPTLGNVMKTPKAKAKMAKTVRVGLTMSQARQRHLFFFVTPKHSSMSAIKEPDNVKIAVTAQTTGMNSQLLTLLCSISIQM